MDVFGDTRQRTRSYSSDACSDLSNWPQLLVWLVDSNIDPYIPVIDKAGRPEGTRTRRDFEWHAENDQYICPEGHALKQFRRNYSDTIRGPTGKGTARYRALKDVCQVSPPRIDAAPTLMRAISPARKTKMRDRSPETCRKTDEYQIAMKLRKKVEMLCAHLKRILGLGRLRLRGPCGANDVRFGLTRPHWGHGPGSLLLAATAQNLRKLAKIFPAPQQTQKA